MPSLDCDPDMRDLIALFREELERCGDFDVGQALPPEEGEVTPVSFEDYRASVASLPPPTQEHVKRLVQDFMEDDDFLSITRAEPHSILLALLPTNITGIPFSSERIGLYGHLHAFVVNAEGYCQAPDPNGCFPEALLPPEVVRAGRILLRWASPDPKSPDSKPPMNLEQEFLAAAQRLANLIWPPAKAQ